MSNKKKIILVLLSTSMVFGSLFNYFFINKSLVSGYKNHQTAFNQESGSNITKTISLNIESNNYDDLSYFISKVNHYDLLNYNINDRKIYILLNNKTESLIDFSKLKKINSQIYLIKLNEYDNRYSLPLIYFDSGYILKISNFLDLSHIQQINNFILLENRIINPQFIESRTKTNKNKTVIYQKKSLTLSESIPNLYRASLVTKNSVNELIKLNKIDYKKVYIGQKIYYEQR